MDNQDNNLVKLKVPNLPKARIWLEWCGIEFVTRENEIFIHKKDWEKANAEFDPPQPPKPPRGPDTYKGGRPTLESQGLHSKERVSASISSEARNYLKDCQEPSENTSQVMNRIILEHKYMLAPHEETE